MKEVKNNTFLFISILLILLFLFVSHNSLSLKKTGSVIVNPSGFRPTTCIDTDAGQNNMVQGTCSDGNPLNPFNGPDTCFNFFTLSEKYCYGNACLSASLLCPQGMACENGACVSVAPPIITSVSDTPDPVGLLYPLTFTASYTPSANINSNYNIIVCKSNALIFPGPANPCPGGLLCQGVGSSTQISCSSTSSDIGTNPYYAFICDYQFGICSSSMQGSYTSIKIPPTLLTITDTPDPVPALTPVEFTSQYSGASGNAHALYVCKTDALAVTSTSISCPGGLFCSGSDPISSSSSSCLYDTLLSEMGTQTYFAFECDTTFNLCSSSLPGTLTVTNPPPTQLYLVQVHTDLDDITHSMNLPAGSIISFHAIWDTYPVAPVPYTFLVCKLPGTLNGQCVGGSWCQNLNALSPTTRCSYQTSLADVGIRSYYAYICSGNQCSSSVISNQFNVVNSGTTCSDSDGGLNYFQSGSCSLGSTVVPDTCPLGFSSKIISEAHCISSTVNNNIYCISDPYISYCSVDEVCVAGACTKDYHLGCDQTTNICTIVPTSGPNTGGCTVVGQTPCGVGPAPDIAIDMLAARYDPVALTTHVEIGVVNKGTSTRAADINTYPYVNVVLITPDVPQPYPYALGRFYLPELQPGQRVTVEANPALVIGQPSNALMITAYVDYSQSSDETNEVNNVKTIRY